MERGSDRPRVPSSPTSVARTEDVDWAGLLRTLWRRRWLTAFVTLACLAAAFAYLSRAEPVFEAEALVMIKEREARITAIQEVMPGLRPSEEGLTGQMLLLRSRNMIESLVDRLDLSEIAEFNPSLREPGLGAKLWSHMARLIPADWSTIPQAVAGNRVLAEADTRRVSELDLALYLREAIVDSVQERLLVQPANSTNVISLRVSSTDPVLAARIANTLAELYIEDTLEEKRAASRRVHAFLDTEISRLRADLLKSELAMQDYRKQAGLVGTVNGPVDSQQLGQLSTELILARSQRASAEARAAGMRGLLAGNRADAAAQYVQSPVLIDVQARELDLKRRLVEAANQFGERHPTMVSLRAEEQELANRKALEIRNLLQGLENEVLAARSRERALEQSLQQTQGRVARLDDASVELQALEREAGANRQLLETYLARQTEIGSQEKAQEPDARVISAAVTADAPVSPRRGLILALSLVGGLFLGSIGAIAAEQFDATVRSGDQLENLFGLTPLGLVPLPEERRPTDRQMADYVLDKPRSRYGEAVRGLRAASLAAAGDTMPLVLLVTSALPGEGKSSTAVGLARLHAQSGARTLLIDADLRRPRLQALLGAPDGPGLGEILQGKPVDPASILHKDERTGLELLAAGDAKGDPTLLLSSPPLRRLLAGLRLRYELIVVDAPPLLGVSDARLLASLTDLSLFVVRWGATQRQDVRGALRILREAGARVAGGVLTMVDAKRHAAYGYSDSGHYYYDRYTKYYDS